MREALSPLIGHRSAKAGPRFMELTFRKSDRNRPQDFFDRYQIGHGYVDPDLVPYYLLVVGSPEEIPFEFQYRLDLTHGVGRLFFEQSDSYRIYAENVVESESSQFSRLPKMALFGAENDALTELSSERLIKPLAEKLSGKVKEWEVEAVTGNEATKARLIQLMDGPGSPALLLTAGHGTYSSRDANRRVREQGSLITSDWQGPGQALSRDHYFSPEDVSDGGDYRGLISFHFACYTAGTPEMDGFAGPGREVRLHDKPFVAPLPRRLLSHPRGSLAVIGHVDQAFQHSFLWDDRIGEIAHFASAFYMLMKGFPVGAAMEPFNRRFATISARSNESRRGDGNTELTRLLYWIGYHDARNYMVLGDPAVFLPNTSKPDSP